MSTATATRAATLSFAAVQDAARRIAVALPPTPAWSYPLLDAAAACSVLVKHENVQPTGAFKVRGGLALLSSLPELPLMLATASTGNHAQSIAFAARDFGVRATIVMPVNAPEIKIAAVRALSADVILHGANMSESMAHAMALSAEYDWHYVNPGDPAIIHGHATVTLELLQSHPDLQAVYVPIGSGTSAAGACIVRDQLAPNCRVIGVQSAQAPAAFNAWSTGVPTTATCTTTASGLATAASFETTQAVLRERLDDFILVDDADIDSARRLLASHAHSLAEGAGAAALAGLLADARRPERCAIILSGGNADARELATLAEVCIADSPTADGPSSRHKRARSSVAFPACAPTLQTIP